jgi:CPA1 family monovalent cation:H+ antiporter
MANAVLFIYLGELLLVNFDLMVQYQTIILKMVLATLLIRGLLMGAFAVISNKSSKLQNIPFHWWVVLTFVGFQGGLSIVLSALVPINTLNYDLIKAVILGNIIVSTFINALVLISYINYKKDLFISEANAELKNSH